MTTRVSVDKCSSLIASRVYGDLGLFQTELGTNNWTTN